MHVVLVRREDDGACAYWLNAHVTHIWWPIVHCSGHKNCMVWSYVVDGEEEGTADCLWLISRIMLQVHELRCHRNTGYCKRYIARLVFHHRSPAEASNPRRCANGDAVSLRLVCSHNFYTSHVDELAPVGSRSSPSCLQLADRHRCTAGSDYHSNTFCHSTRPSRHLSKSPTAMLSR